MKNKVFVAIALEVDGQVQQFDIPAESFKQAINNMEIDKDTEVIELALNVDNKIVKVPINISDVRKMIKGVDLYENIIPKKLSGYLSDVTQKIITRKRAPLVGRDKEIKKAWNFLSQSTRNNVVFTGEIEVGKTAIAYELIRQIATNECPEEFYEKRVLKFNPHILLREIEADDSKHQTKYIKSVIEELYKFLAENKDKLVLYIDDVIYMKTDENLMDILNHMIKHYNIPLIMATSYENFEWYFLNDFIISKYVNEVYVEEPVYDDVLPMLKNFIKNHEKKTKMTMPEDVAKFAIFTSGMYDSVAYNPGLSKSIIKRAFVEAKLDGKTEVDRQSVIKCYNINTKLYNAMSEETKRATAYHEAGHYITHVMSDNIKEAAKIAVVSILPCDWFLGVNMLYDNIEDNSVPNKDYYTDMIASNLAGRVAENRVTKSYTSGAYSDLEHANYIAREASMRCGLSEEEDNLNRYYDYEDYYLLPENKKKLLDEERKKWIDRGYARAEEILTKYDGLLTTIAERLLTDEVLTGEELKTICDEYINGKEVVENEDSEENKN